VGSKLVRGRRPRRWRIRRGIGPSSICQRLVRQTADDGQLQVRRIPCLLSRADPAGRTRRHGMPGVGKSQLVQYWATSSWSVNGCETHGTSGGLDPRSRQIWTPRSVSPTSPGPETSSTCRTGPSQLSDSPPTRCSARWTGLRRRVAPSCHPAAQQRRYGRQGGAHDRGLQVVRVGPTWFRDPRTAEHGHRAACRPWRGLRRSDGLFLAPFLDAVGLNPPRWRS